MSKKTANFEEDDSIIYNSKSYALSFYVISSEEILEDTNVHIRNKKIMEGDKPAPDGLYDPHMGTTDLSWACHTCRNSKNNCPGHFGSIDLKYPVKSPMFRDELLKWLKITCYNCGKLVVNSKISVSAESMLSELIKNIKSVKDCSHCGEPHYQVIRDKSKTFTFLRIKEDGKRVIEKKEFFNHEIKAVLEKISDETVLKMGKPLRCHPRNFILTTVNAPPNSIRPDIKRIGGARSSNSDTTSLMKTIFEINEVLPDDIPPIDQISQSLRDAYGNLDMTYYTMVKGGGGGDVKLITNTSKPPVAIAERFPKKQGRIRRNLMGKRVEYMIRSVITGDSRLRVNEVGVPMIHARDLEVPEKVTSASMDRLLRYFVNGTKIYPGCKHIIKADGGIYRRDLIDPNYKLQIGDTVMRDIITGDCICFNRQPSLLFSNIAGMRVVVMEVGNTLRINPAVCKYFNADFDGDQMNSIVPQNIVSRNECMTVSKVSRWLISPQDHAPMVGAFQDALIGLFELTKSGLEFNKWHSMQLFGDINTTSGSALGSASGTANSYIDQDFKSSIYTNRQLVSKLLPKINFSGKDPSFYKDQYKHLIKYNPEDIKVNIVRGELTSGILDKASAGQGVGGSIFHVIANEYGNDYALDVVYNFQQIVHRFLGYHGFTVGINDVMISDKAKKEIERRLADMITKSRIITQKLNTGKLIAPLGVSLNEYYEAEQIGVLTPGDDFSNPILEDIDIDTNQIARLILSGSKGKITNIISLNASNGMLTINGKRFGYHQAGWGRTSPYFVRYDTEPEATGFVSMSYREGVSNAVYSFIAGEGRHGSISNALSTSITGYQNRIAIKNLESILVDNLRKTTKGMNVIQPLCYESGVDPSKLEKVKFPTVTLSDADFKAKYMANIKLLDKKYQSGDNGRKVEEIIEQEFKQLNEDRDKYRRIHMELERFNPKEYVMSNSKYMPVNVARVVEDAIYNNLEIIDKMPDKDKVLDPIYVYEKVKDLCDILGYTFLNEVQKKLRRKLPRFIVASTNMLQILIRSHLCISNLVSKGAVNKHIDIIIEKILLMYKKSLIDYGTSVGIIAAQCICEKFTQYVLDSKHRTGGQGGTKTNAIIRMQEILGAKDTLAMKNPHMMIMVKPEYENDRVKVQEIANHIEMLMFGRFISDTRVFFEEYGKPTHPSYKHEADDIKDFEKHNYGIKIPGDLAKWCIRFGINKEELILKSMKLETIVMSLRKNHPEVFIVYTPENADDVYIRVYLRTSMFKPRVDYYTDNVLYTMEELKKVIVRGVADIIATSVIDVMRNEVNEKGALVVKKVYGIYTTGSNMSDILRNKYIDPYRTQSDSVQEIERVFGLVAARQKIINEMIIALDELNRMQCTIFADEMCYSGVVSNIQKTGLQKRENANVTLRLSFQTAVQVIQGAAVHGLVDTIGGISGPLVMGTNPSIGTTFNKIVVNQKFLEENSKSLESIISNL
jgi:DNA-directed RNA polymerase II subunit RPB1